MRDVLGLPGYGQFYKGNHITTMSYDWWKGADGTRFTLQEIFLSNLAHTLYDDGRAPSTEPTWWGLQKKQALSTFNNHIEVLAMVEDTHDGEFLAPPPTGSHIRPNAGPVGIGPVQVRAVGPVDRGARGGQRGDHERGVAQRPGALREADLRQPQRRPPAGRVPDGRLKDFGVVDHRSEAFGYEGLFCMDSSSIPTSLGVNPSLTISAVAERACEQLIHAAADFGLPAAPAGFKPGSPGVHLGPHTDRRAPPRTRRSTRRCAATARPRRSRTPRRRGWCWRTC